MVSLPGCVLLRGVPWPLPCSRSGTRFHQPPRLFSFDAAEMRSHPASEMMVTVEMCLSFPGGLFFWGATNTSRESTMYPKAVQDLCGWRIRSLACGYVTMSPVSGMSVPARACWTQPGGALSLEGSTLPLGCQVPPVPESGGDGLCSEQGGLGGPRTGDCLSCRYRKSLRVSSFRRWVVSIHVAGSKFCLVRTVEVTVTQWEREGDFKAVVLFILRVPRAV